MLIFTCFFHCHLCNISYAHPAYVICFVALSFLSYSRGGLPPSIVARFVARDPVSFECWFAWLHQSRVIILSSYRYPCTPKLPLPCARHIEISDQALKLQILYKSDERSCQLHIARLTLLYLSFIMKRLDAK